MTTYLMVRLIINSIRVFQLYRREGRNKLKSLSNPYKAGIKEGQDLFIDDLEAPSLRQSSADTSPKLSVQELFVFSHGSTEGCTCVDCGLCRDEHPLFHQGLVYFVDHRRGAKNRQGRTGWPWT